MIANFPAKLPTLDQEKAFIEYPPYKRPFCIAPKSLWQTSFLHKCRETNQHFRKAGEFISPDPDSQSPPSTLIPFCVVSDPKVRFLPMHPWYRSSPQWIKEKWSLYLRAPGEWLVEEWNRIPRTCLEADPGKTYPLIEWDEELTGKLAQTLPTISRVSDEVWQRELRYYAGTAAAEEKRYANVFN